MNEGGWTEANVVAAAVRILGGAQKVADSLGVSRSQVYRWIKARSMAHATYIYVAKLASLSGIDTGFLGGDGSALPSNNLKEANKKSSTVKNNGSPQSSGNDRTTRLRAARIDETASNVRQPLHPIGKANWQEVDDRAAILSEEHGRNDVQKGGTQQNCLLGSNGVSPSRGEHYGRRKTLRTKGQEESREHQP